MPKALYSTGAGVTRSYGPPNIDAGNWTQDWDNSSSYFSVVLFHESVLVITVK